MKHSMLSSLDKIVLALQYLVMFVTTIVGYVDRTYFIFGLLYGIPLTIGILLYFILKSIYLHRSGFSSKNALEGVTLSVIWLGVSIIFALATFNDSYFMMTAI